MPSIANSTRTFMKAQIEPKKPKPPRKKLAVKIKLPKSSLAWWLVLALIVFSVFMFVQYREAQSKLRAATPAAAAQQVNDVVAKVRKLAVVPANETPTVATIKDVNKLKGYTFFAKARQGDKLLVFKKDNQAILYRPSTNQIVTISTVQTTPPDAAAPVTQ